MGEGDRRRLAALVLSRVVAPGAGEPASVIRSRIEPDVEDAVRVVVRRASEAFVVDLDDEDFILRLALHVQNLRLRAREQAWSRNPLTRSLKATHPMIFEIAVFVADGLQGLLGMPLLDDEIAYIAMHVGFLDHSDHAYAKKFYDRVRELGDRAGDAGVTLLMETGQESAEDLQRFAETLNHPNVLLNFAPANLILYNKDEPLTAFRRLAPWVRHIHIKDA